MERRIVYMMLASALLGGTAFLSLPERGRARILIASAGGEAVFEDSLEDRTTYYFVSDTGIAAHGADPLAWFVYDETGRALSYTMADNALEQSFNRPGRYELQAIRSLRIVAQTTVTVVEGERFVPKLNSAKSLDTLGAAFEFSDDSRHVKERRWSVRKGDRIYKDTTSVEQFIWLASDTGTFTVRLEVTLRSEADHSEETELVVELPAPPIVQKNTSVKKGPSPEELAAQRANREEYLRKRQQKYDEAINAADDLFSRKDYKAARAKYKLANGYNNAESYPRNRMTACDAAIADQERAAQSMKDQAKARQRSIDEKNEADKKVREELARQEEKRRKHRKDSIDAITPSCFSMARLGGESFEVEVATPARSNAKFRSGSVEFVLDALVDCRLTGFKYYANANAGTTKITVECLEQDCEGRRRGTTFEAAQDYDDFSKTSKLNMPVFAAGRRYRVKIETADAAELGFFGVPNGGEVSNDALNIKFSKAESCVFDLVFAH